MQDSEIGKSVLAPVVWFFPHPYPSQLILRIEASSGCAAKLEILRKYFEGTVLKLKAFFLSPLI